MLCNFLKTSPIPLAFLVVFAVPALNLALGKAIGAEPVVEVKINPGPRGPGWKHSLTPKEQEKVNEAIEKGIVALQSGQLPNGSFGDGVPAKTNPASLRWWPVAYAAFPGLALLESGLPPGNKTVEKAATFVRENAGTLNRTYEIPLAILFLDRLGREKDRPLIRSLALRLVAGQTKVGGWAYTCPILAPAQETKLLEKLQKQKGVKDPKPFPLLQEQADNSNTQFAILGLWTAKRQELPLDFPISLVERRFQSSQQKTGWSYRMHLPATNGSMTCAGLLGLAAGQAVSDEDFEAKKNKAQDARLQWGLFALANHMNVPTDVSPGWLGPPGTPNLYFLWSVERVGVLCNLDTIGGRDWYRWGVELLLKTQNKDGSWTGRGNGPNNPVIDTSMALLFLKKSDLLPDLRETLHKRILITDPGLDLKAPFDPKMKTDKFDPKTFIPSKSPGDKSSPGTRENLPAPDAPLSADLGDVKSGQSAKLPLRVRGPVPFKISAIKETDDQLRVDPPTGAKEVHELTLLLRPEKAGPFQRTLILYTDIPGRSEVPIEIKVRVGR